jgi:sulfur carrier protein ThiS
MARKAVMVKVARTGGKAVEVALNGERTIVAALKGAEFTKKSSEVVQVNGDEIDEDEFEEYELEDGDKVILVKNIEGGIL